MNKKSILFTILIINFAFSHYTFGIKTIIPSHQVDTNVILPPAWAFGILYGGYTNQEQTIQRIDEIQHHNYPIDAYWIDS